jgi:uncharacterized protein YlxW (UPF0749 family)
MRAVTGASPGIGRGVWVSISDPEAELEPYDLLNLVNELRSAGAEALVIGDRRVDFRASFTGRAGAILVSGTPLRAPYRLGAIGNPDYLTSSLVMAGGVVPSLENRPGVTVAVTKEEALVVPAFQVVPAFVHASKAGD